VTTFAGSKRVIVKAVKEGRWGKVRALQRLLTHSVRHVWQVPVDEVVAELAHDVVP